MKKKILSMTLSLALIFCSLIANNNIGKSLAAGEDDWTYMSGYDDNGIPMFPYVDFGPFVSEDDYSIGTAEEPYIISTAAQLAALSVLSNKVDELDNPELGEFYYLCDRYENLRGGEDFNGKYFVVENDIDLSQYRWTPIGINHSFKGNINFQGHTVDGIRMMVKDGQDTKLLGLFAKSEGSISNLTIGERGSFHCVTNDVCFGSVVGINSGRVFNCRNNFNAEVNGELSAIAGGIVGRNTGEGNIDRCINAGRISAASFEYEVAGGIVGDLENGIVTLCNNRGNICVTNFKSPEDGSVFTSQKRSYVGGIVGGQSSTLSQVIKCISSGNLEFLSGVEELRCGEIVGTGYTGCVRDCYYLTRPEREELFTFSENGFFEMILVAGNGSFPGIDLGSSTICVNQARLDQIRQQLNIPA